MLFSSCREAGLALPETRALLAALPIISNALLTVRGYQASSAHLGASTAQADHARLGQLCTQFKRYARENNVEWAARAHAQYLAAGGRPQLWMANMLLGAYARRREASAAWALFQRLLAEGQLEPNLFTYAAVLNALAKGGHPPYDLPPEAAARAEAVVAQLRAAGLHPNQVVYHTLMDCQAKAAQPEAALRTLREMQTDGLSPTTQSFAILIAAYGRAGRRTSALQVVDGLMRRAGVAPDASVWNALLGVYANGGSVDAAYATWIRMLDAGIVPDEFTERKLAEAFASHPLLAAEVVGEARTIRRQHAALQQRWRLGDGERAAAAAGEREQQQACEGEWGSAGNAGEEAEDGHAAAAAAAGTAAGASPPARPQARQAPLRVDRLERASGAELLWARRCPGGGGGAEGEDDAPHADAGLRRLLYLDLHGQSQAAARMSVLRRLEVLVSLGPQLAAAMGGATTAAGGMAGQQQASTTSSSSQGQDEPEQQAPAQQPCAAGARRRPRGPRPWEQGLVVVTGSGRHSRADAPGVVRAAVAELLATQGLPAAPDPRNPGRLVVPWPALHAFVASQREAMSTDHFLAAARARYTYVAAGAAGLLAAAVLVPRLGPWLGA